MPMTLLQIDAFTDVPFKGNPAAVCLLEEPRDAEWMQAVAAEMNLSETAFVVRREDGFGLRWFTPTTEVPLCGHATLASAHALWETGKLKQDETARFHTLSGLLTAQRNGARIEMNLPAIPIEETIIAQGILEAVGLQPRFVGRTADRNGEAKEVNYLFELDTEDAVRNARPNFEQLKKETDAGIIITARAQTTDCDFVSRYFVPAFGINEDPVTGAAHCSLAPYWSGRLTKTEMTGYQASARGGFVYARLLQNRVVLAGEAVTVLQGILMG
ncbi:MAG: PhzF family phenazine biosynthesis protein [Acidobacteria bacterium]|nr:PhzF family phenazine biosynthesis protein [Acidobacteriota bacterium]